MARKLTKEIIRTVAKVAVEDVSREKIKEIKKRRGVAGYALFVSLAGEDVIGKLMQLPSEFVNHTTNFDIGKSDPEGHKTSSLDGKKFKDWIRVEFDEYKPCLGPNFVYAQVWSVEPDNQLYLKYLEINQELKDAKELVERGKYKIMAMLTGAKTVEKAMAVWPEGATYLEQYLEEPTSLPAVQIEEVREILTQIGTPVAQAA